MSQTIVVMGVAGVGKTTIGRRLADALRVPFLDADDFHSDRAKANMRAGVPLTEHDREPWLERLNAALRAHRASGAVLACSALTEHGRRLLTAGLAGVRFVLLTADPALIRRRLAARRGHYAGPELLESQLETLEAPRDAVTVDASGAPSDVTARALAALGPAPDQDQEERSTSI